MTWLLIIVLCLDLGGGEAECRRDTSGPYLTPGECHVMRKPTKAIVEEVAADFKAKVLFFSTKCERGLDG